MCYRCEERHAVRWAELKFDSDNGPLTVIFLFVKKQPKYIISNECLTLYHVRLSAVQLKNYKNVLWYETVKAGFKFLFRAAEFQLYKKTGRNIVSCTSQCHLNIRNWCYLHGVDCRPLIYGSHENPRKLGPTGPGASKNSDPRKTQTQ